MNRISALNTGIIANVPPLAPTRPQKGTGRKTIIVTGIARSGTSLFAALLKEAGVFMGEFLHDVVHEDAQILEFLRSRDMRLLKTLIERRNTKHDLWGFKVPNLHAFLQSSEISLFRNPHLIVVYRDPVAVAVRNALSEHLDERTALLGATNAMDSLAHFIDRAECPVLMLSYEKALSFPNIVIDTVSEFCGVKVEQQTRNQLFVQIQPNRAEYLAAATRHFAGYVDGILEGQLRGWCVQVGRIEPVQLSLFADEQLVASFRADKYREDLAIGGVGNGCHGFSVNLSPFHLRGSNVIRIKVRDRVLELENSGKRLDSYEVMMHGI